MHQTLPLVIWCVEIFLLVNDIDNAPTLKMIDHHESFKVVECLNFWPMIVQCLQLRQLTRFDAS